MEDEELVPENRSLVVKYITYWKTWYKEGSKSDGITLITNRVIQSKSKNIANRHLPHLNGG